MHVVEIFLPLTDNDGHPFPKAHYARRQAQLLKMYGGVTVYAREPADGRWQAGGKTVADALVIFEVMTPELDTEWWRDFRESLELEFRQSEILIRATATQKL